MKKGYLYLVIIFVVIIFGAGLLLFTKNQGEEEDLADYSDYAFSFDEVTIPGEKLVVFDNSNLDFSRYYVIKFSGAQYIVYSYYFMGNHDKYIKKYNEVAHLVSDYNYDEFMIETVDYINYGTYDEFLSNLETVLNDELMYIIY